jgi:hypothetical protein
MRRFLLAQAYHMVGQGNTDSRTSEDRHDGPSKNACRYTDFCYAFSARKTTFMRAISAILVLAFFIQSSFAAEKQAKTPPTSAQQAKPKFRPFHGTIKSFDKAAKTVTLNGAKAQTFAVIAETKINKDGKPATVEALVAGETLGGRARQAPDGRWEALTLNVGKKPANPTKAEPKKPSASPPPER